MKQRILSFVIIASCFFINIYAINPLQEQSGEAEWVAQTYNSMSLDQKIGQLFMVCCSAGKLVDNAEVVKKWIQDLHIGGVIFMTSDATKQVQLTNEFQGLSKTPLLISTDAEHGVAMRLHALPGLPQQLMLGAITDNNLVYEYGREVACQCKRLGVQVDFAPVADVNNNPLNPIIGNRSFGESVSNVTQKAIAFMRGLHDGGVLACFKHFPGHGDTVNDSHETLPVISHARERLNAVELEPFKQGIQAGVGAIMTAHLNVPVLDDTPHIPSSLSPKVVTDLLQKELGFKGLIFTDGLKMKGVRSFLPEDGSTELEALKAGNHILLGTAAVDEGFAKIKEALQTDEQLHTSLSHAVKKILQYKYRLGCAAFQKISTKNVESEIITQSFWDLKKRIINQALTYVGPDQNQETLKLLSKYAQEQLNTNQPLSNFAVISVNPADTACFQAAFAGNDASIYSFDSDINADVLQILLKQVEDHKQVIVAVHGMNRLAGKKFGIAPQVQEAIKALVTQKNAIVVLFGSPYAASFFKDCPQVIVAYNNDPLTQEITAQKLLGGDAFVGVLPVSI